MYIHTYLHTRQLHFISFYIHLYVDAHARFFVYTCHTVNFQ